MAFKKPIIASNLYQLREVFENPAFSEDIKVGTETDSFLFEPNDHKEFENLIKYISSEYEQLSHIGENAYKNVMDHYTWDHHVGAIMEQYTGAQK